MTPARPGPAPPPARPRRPSRATGPASTRAAAATLSGLLLAGLLAALVPDDARAQQRRRAAVPYAPDAAGRLLVGAGAAWEADARFPLSGLRGDLVRPGTITLSYSFAPGAVFRIEGDALRVLSVERRGASAIPLEEGVDDGTTEDAGDFRLSTLFRLLGGPEGLSGGLHLAAKLPNSDERAGIGLNTTDVFLSAFGSWSGGRWRVNGDLGVGILEAPLERFVQDDVLIYAGEVLFRPRPGGVLRLWAAASGRANTRGAVPLGNEDRGRAEAGAELLLGPWRADAGLTVGYAGTSPDWGVSVGVARVLGG